MSSSMIDSSYFENMFGTVDMRQIFSDTHRTQIWLDVEVALARAEENVGVIPPGTAETIAATARVENLDLESMREGFRKSGFPVIPFVREFIKVCDPEAAKWIHYGSTSQDIQDTGMVLQLRQAFAMLEADLARVISLTADLAETHKNTVMAGRSFQQHAAPITFGFKTAVWLEELLRHRERLQELKPRLLVGQCFGAVGTLATLGDQGPEVRREFMKQLGLGITGMPWHAARDSITEAVQCLGLCTATMARIANEVAILMRTEIDELREPAKQGRGGSSTMPQKRNPVLCEPVIAAAHRLRELGASQQTAMIQEHERGVGHMHLEWMVIPDACILASSAFSHMIELLDGLYVNKERMQQNLSQGGGYIMAEAVMMGLAPHIGRQAAHECVAAVTVKGREQGLSLRETLLADETIASYLSVQDLDRLLDPNNYTGRSSDMIDDILAQVRTITGGTM